MSSKTDFVRGVRPCIVALRVDADDEKTSWDVCLNTKSPQQPLCFSVFQADAKEAITITQGLAFLHFGFTSNHDGSISRHEFDTPKEITFVINFTNSEALQELMVNLPCPCSYSHQLIDDKSIQCGYKLLYGLFNHVLTRSYDYMLRDRTVVLIGAGYFNTQYLFKYIAHIKAHIILLDDNPPPEWASGVVTHFIEVSLHEPAHYEETAKKAAAKLKELNVELFSVYTVCEDCVPFRALLTSVLHQEGTLKSKHHTISFENALRNKDKFHVYSNMQEMSYSDPIAPNAIILTDENVSTSQIERPHILKLSTSCGAFGCMRINTTEHIVPAYQEAKTLIADTSSDIGLGMCFDVLIFMSELYEGSEHDLEIIMYNGEPAFYIFSDNLPVAAGEGTDGIQFLEKGCVMPSKIIMGQEAKEIICTVVRVLTNLDLSHGVFNVEFIFTAHGIKIIDVNPRPGGFYINEWVNTITGVCTFAAELILRSELEYFVQPLVNSQRITGDNVFSKKQLTKEMARHVNDSKDTRVFHIQDPDKEADPRFFYATIYEVTDFAF